MLINLPAIAGANVTDGPASKFDVLATTR